MMENEYLVKLEAIELKELSSKALILAAKISRNIFKLNQRRIALAGSGLFSRLTKEVGNVNNQEVTAIYAEFVNELMTNCRIATSPDVDLSRMKSKLLESMHVNSVHH